MLVLGGVGESGENVGEKWVFFYIESLFLEIFW